MSQTTIGSKPGYLTTEFWLTILSQVGTLIGAFSGAIPPKWAAIITAAMTGIYGIVRAFTKASVGDSSPTNPINAKPPTS